MAFEIPLALWVLNINTVGCYADHRAINPMELEEVFMHHSFKDAPGVEELRRRPQLRAGYVSQGVEEDVVEREEKEEI
jgi:hypothetical protein